MPTPLTSSDETVFAAALERSPAERQALALMDHPNIARVFDGGATEAGRPFFVMELVRGVPITKFCDEQNLPTAARLELFTAVCHAVQHAHQKGIIHRDLKPSNILVTLHDGRPVPKVIDFGIAKATQGKLTDATLFTAFEQFIGTPAYMSPEQAELSGLDIDTRSDIYSLGVLLYELLTGRPPFDPKTLLNAGLDEIRRIIREVEPPRPSTRLSTLADADRATIAKQRGTAPAHLSVLLRGDLDWIVMRCLEKDRTRRYDTPSALAADLNRHLINEPVTARPPSGGYRLRKFVRRHRLALAVAGAFTLLLMGAVVVSTWQAVRATRAQRREEVASLKSRQVAAFLSELLQSVDPAVALGRDKTLLLEILDKAAKRIDTELAAQPAVRAELLMTMARAYGALGEPKALGMLEETLAIRRQLFGREHIEVAESLIGTAVAYHHLGRYAESEQYTREAIAIARKVLPARDPRLGMWLATFAGLLVDRGKLEEAEAIAREAVAILCSETDRPEQAAEWRKRLAAFNAGPSAAVEKP
ncbi:MAG: serine/threonine protein kinase [Candidatus Omnitrophica bacterium]|nr:serine/threonine protein kinase [Candidatus Omnitrophota bacterium]